MEKFSQFRDRGSGISPFIPVVTPSSLLGTVLRALLFLFRLPVFLAYAVTYFLVLHHLPLPDAARKILLWGFMAVPGIWWVELQLDGVRRGTLAEQPPHRVPHRRSLIAASFTSPIDALYLAAVFDPIFVLSYPSTRRVQPISLASAIALALGPVRLRPSPASVASGRLTDLATLLAEHPDRVIAIFPECATTNGKAVLPLSPGLLSCPPQVRIFPVSIRYAPPDVTTPLPGRWLYFLWKLLSRPTTCLRVRIADGIVPAIAAATAKTGLDTNSGPTHPLDAVRPAHHNNSDDDEDDSVVVTPAEQRLLDQIGDTLARLGRNKRVGLTLRDKTAFIDVWLQKK